MSVIVPVLATVSGIVFGYALGWQHGWRESEVYFKAMERVAVALERKVRDLQAKK